MRLLLDTSVVLRVLLQPSRLQPSFAELLTEGGALAWFSAAVPWEVAIKATIGKLAVDPALLVGELLRQDISELPIRAAHALETAALPPLHKDPFDRIQIAQARVERLTFATTDRALGRYDVALMLL